jgi:hypothetical protein
MALDNDNDRLCNLWVGVIKEVRVKRAKVTTVRGPVGCSSVLIAQTNQSASPPVLPSIQGYGAKVRTYLLSTYYL